MMWQDRERMIHLSGQYALPIPHYPRELHSMLKAAADEDQRQEYFMAERYVRAAIRSFPDTAVLYEKLAW